MLRSLTLVLTGALVTSNPATAQDRGVPLHGVVFDSLRGGPLAGATIRLANADARTASDSQGRFRFESVPPGARTFIIEHGVLDTIGLGPIPREVVVVPNREVRLGLPSFATIWRAACGTGPVPRDSGVVYGAVRHALTGERVPEALIDVTWLDTDVNRRRQVEQQAWHGHTHSDDRGAYAVCGAPPNSWLRIQASAEEHSSGLIDLPPTPLRVQRRDLLVGPPVSAADSALTGIIAGILTDSLGPFPNARVVLEDTIEVRSGVDGRFVIHGVRPGTRQIEIMALGMRPVFTVVDVYPFERSHLELDLHRVTTLDVVRVTATGRQALFVQEFEMLRRASGGYTFDSTFIESRPNVQAVLREIPSVQLRAMGGSVSNFFITLPGPRGGQCNAEIWLDGRRSSPNEISLLRQSEIAAIQAFPRAMGVPDRYMNYQCGVVVVWTKWFFR